MFNIIVMGFYDLSNLSGLVILVRRMTRGYWTRWGSVEVLPSRCNINVMDFVRD